MAVVFAGLLLACASLFGADAPGIGAQGAGANVPDPSVTAVRAGDGASATVSWTAWKGKGFEYYRVIVCDDSQYDGKSCSARSGPASRSGTRPRPAR